MFVVIRKCIYYKYILQIFFIYFYIVATWIVVSGCFEEFVVVKTNKPDFKIGLISFILYSNYFFKFFIKKSAMRVKRW